MALYKPYHLVSNDLSNQEDLLWCWREQSREVFFTWLTLNWHMDSKDLMCHNKKWQQNRFTLSQHRDLPGIFRLITSHKASCYLFSDRLSRAYHLSFLSSFLHWISASLIHPTASLWGVSEGVLETRCPGFLGSGQDWGLGDIESTLVSRGASHHQLAGNTIWSVHGLILGCFPIEGAVWGECPDGY